MEHKLLFAYEIIKVIYSPFRAFREIIQNPKYIGPIVVMILFVAAYTGFSYIATSKLYDEQTLPIASKGDEWTENRDLWTSNASVVAESDDCLSGGWYGNKSIEFSIVNYTQIWMQLNPPESINCSSSEGYKKISFRIKMIYPNTTELDEASLYLFSGQAEYFHYDLTEQFVSLNKTVWNNLTVTIGAESELAEKSANADWSNVTSLGFKFMWSQDADLTVRIDGLFFRGVFKPIIEDVPMSVFNFSVGAFMQFTIKWVILSGLLYIMVRAFGAKTTWRPLLILVGFVLITIFIQAAINAVAFSTLPRIYRPLELAGGVGGEFEIAYNNFIDEIWLVDQIYRYVQIGVLVWTIALCSIATRELAEFSWTKSFLVSIVAYFISMMAENFILGF